MPRLSFITPAALALLALLPILWALTFLAPRRVAPWRRWLGLLIRSAMLVALVLGLAGAQLVRPVSALTTVFLIDASDSVAPTQRERAGQYVEEAIRAMPASDRAAVVVFGENALVERAPSSLAALGRLSSVPITRRTNIQDAVQLGLALLPADAQKRLVLLSDGGENSGRAVDAARLARARGVPLDAVALPSERGADVLISALDAPAIARERSSCRPRQAATDATTTKAMTHGLTRPIMLETNSARLEILKPAPGMRPNCMAKDAQPCSAFHMKTGAKAAAATNPPA